MNIAAKTFGKGYRRGPTALSSQYSLNGRGAPRPASGFRARFTSRGRARATSVGLRPPSVTHANIMARRSKESNPQAQGQGITVDQTGHLRHDLNASVASLRGVAVFIGISGRFRRNTQLISPSDQHLTIGFGHLSLRPLSLWWNKPGLLSTPIDDFIPCTPTDLPAMSTVASNSNLGPNPPFA